jgi:hypothetical protein
MPSLLIPENRSARKAPVSAHPFGVGAKAVELVERIEISQAFHESGHAVVALKSGLAIRYVTLRPRGHNRAGLVKTAGSWFYSETSAQVYLAGAIAQRRYLGRQLDPIWGSRDRWIADKIFQRLAPHKGSGDANFAALYDDDFEDTTEGLWHLLARENLTFKPPKRPGTRPRESARSLERRLRRETKLLVAQNWAAITAVANALIARRTLSAAEVKRIVARFIRPETESNSNEKC